MNFENLVEMFPEHEIRYKIALCLEQIHETSEALAALNGISNRQRNLKVNMMIGKLSMQLGKCTNAETAFKAVVRESPMNLEAMRGLLSLGVSDMEISNIIVECMWNSFAEFVCFWSTSHEQLFFFIFTASLPIQLVEWINTWLNISVCIRKCQFAEAISSLETLRTTSMFGNNELVTVMLGQCYYYNGDHDIALTHLHRAHATNFYILDGLSKWFI